MLALQTKKKNMFDMAMEQKFCQLLEYVRFLYRHGQPNPDSYSTMRVRIGLGCQSLFPS